MGEWQQQPKMGFDVESVLSQLKQSEKIALLSGIDFWHTYPIPEHNVPSIRFTDGPNGIRGTKFFAGVPAACLPCGTALAATWDKRLLKKAGKLLGDECIAKGAHCWLGPTINTPRSPLGGRGFESFSEDPHLSGILAASIILGCESTGVTSCVKHFVGNDQEHERRAVDCLITPRALREVYLRPFQIVARDSKPGALMTSYNKVNGCHVADSTEMLQDIVRQEWKWDPLIVSDWYGTYTTINALKAGLDLEMPGVSRYRGKYVESALQARLLKQSTIDERARRVLKFAQKAGELKVSQVERGRDFPEDRALNRQICSSSIVLLKNNDSLLPLPKTIAKIALIGSHVRLPAIAGGGSASPLPYYSVSLYDAVAEALPGASITHEVGAYAHQMLPVIEAMLRNAVINFYNDPSHVSGRQLLGREIVSSTSFQLMDYNAIPTLNKALFWGTLMGDFIPNATGTWEFGLSVFGTANLYIDDELVIDNTTHQTRGTAFFGKGTIEMVGTRELVCGSTYKIRLEFGSANTTGMETTGVVNFGGGAVHLGACLKRSPQEMVASAIQAAADADYTIICTGLNGEWESEGFDRPHMDLPPGVDNMISQVLNAAPNAVVVNQSGTPVTMPWASKARAIVQAWYGGNETGHGISDVLFGSINPSGKLPLSWPVHVKHNPAYLNYASVGGRVLYGEDVYAGYKFYEKTEREVLFPFGHGLSYATFELLDPVVKTVPEIFRPNHPSVAIVKIKNTSRVPGAQVLQLYISAPNSPMYRPEKELHGFEKVFLEAGEEKEVQIAIDQYATSFWDEIESMWKSEKGAYDVLIGVSSLEILGKGKLIVPETRFWLGL
ncbi:glycoside hydrolase family 3 protein [Trichoderma ceciliae]